MIPPADFVILPEHSSSSSSNSTVTRAFFRKTGPRGVGRRESIHGNGRGHGGSHHSHSQSHSHSTTTVSQSKSSHSSTSTTPRTSQQMATPRGNRQIKSAPSAAPSNPVHQGGNRAKPTSTSTTSSSQLRPSRGGMAGSVSGRGGHQGSTGRGGGTSGNQGRGGNHTTVNASRGGARGRGRGRN